MNSRIRNLVTFLLLISATPLLKAKTEIYSTYVNWSAGDVFNYTITKSKEKPNQNGGLDRTMVESKIRIEVTNKKDSVYELNWIVGNSAITVGPEISNKLAQDFVNLMKGSVLELVVDNQGIPKDLKNFTAVKDKVIGVLDSMIATRVVSGDISTEQAKNLRNLAMQSYESKELMLSTALPEVSLFFAAHGYELSAEQFIAFEGEIANPLGGEAFPMKGTVELEGFDQDNKTITVGWSQIPDPDELNRIMIDTISSIAAQQGVAPPSKEQLPPMTRTNKALYVFDQGTSVVRSIQHTQVVDLGIVRNTETMKFELD